jgi:hypothetical protein
MKPLYWVLIIVGAVASAIAITLVITKRRKDEEVEQATEDATEDAERRAFLELSMPTYPTSEEAFNLSGTLFGLPSDHRVVGHCLYEGPRGVWTIGDKPCKQKYTSLEDQA